MAESQTGNCGLVLNFLSNLFGPRTPKIEDTQPWVSKSLGEVVSQRDPFQSEVQVSFKKALHTSLPG